MAIGYQILEWDSDFFDRKIGRITRKRVYPSELRRVLKRMAISGIDLAYLFTGSVIGNPNQFQDLASVDLINTKVKYAKTTDLSIVGDTAVKEYSGNSDNPQLIDLSIQSGVYSRFRLDQRMGLENFERLYSEWMVRSIKKEIAICVLVYLEEEQIAGVVTLNSRNGVGQIGVIGVDSNYRGKGIGSALMKSAEQWFGEKGFSEIEVVTQGENIPACRLYEKCGYHIATSEYTYHIWFN